ncbi:hypothetical protein PENSTE_c025G04286 [Penicillium steckii]|uniref:Dipeptidyl aminopeptidase III n=1 Tax=Penicillium steckii TaxID=303698 RepID=A0A1V6SQ49_9EURO|nr:hypothetical protein PENSTE_c025G04286 [Penicillium steckii]
MASPNETSRELPTQLTATHQLHIEDLFKGLTNREKLYAHHLSRAAWYGSRIILRQTSAEAEKIFDFIIGLHKACQGEWNKFIDNGSVSRKELDNFLEFSGLFLSNLGNYFGDGDTKVVPDISADALRKMARISAETKYVLESIIGSLLETPPYSLGFPDGNSTSNYYIGKITKEEVEAIARAMEKYSIEPENTRIFKVTDRRGPLHVTNELEAPIYSEIGDHSREMGEICSALTEASKYTANEKQTALLQKYIESFQTGSMKAYREAQKIWVSDVSPRVENILGFVEPYRDPYGVRAEWEGAVCISDPDETSKLKALVDNSTKFIRMLPWAVPGVNDGKGPFEANLFQAPDFTIVHSLAFCTSHVWEAVNLPNYSDIRESYGSKNILFANRMNVNSNVSGPCKYVHPSVAEQFGHFNPAIRFIVTAVHELLGHGTGKLLGETSLGTFNFDIHDLPINPFTKQPIKTWYQPGQTWTSVFGKLATSIEECRAMLVSYYLADNKELLAMFGYDDKSPMKADDIIYFAFLHIGVEGIKALRAFNVQDQAWGQPHARANFAILKHLLKDGEGVMSVEHDPLSEAVHVHVNRSRISSSGKSSIGRMLHRIHVWRCVADVESCRKFYEDLSVVDGEYEAWRQVVIANPEPKWKFVQPNTFLKNDCEVELRVYENSNEGIIQSFADRGIYESN